MSDKVTKTTKKQEKIKTLLEDLKNQSTTKVKTVLDALQILGEATILKDIITAIDLNDLKSERNNLIIEFLNSLKDSSCREEIINLLEDSSIQPYKKIILSTIWNSPLDYSEYIDLFVKIACEGDLIEALDCLTIIENMEGPFEEEQVMEAKLILNNYMENKSEDTPQKEHLISEIALILRTIQLQLDIEE
jgi:hypothetical protein